MIEFKSWDYKIQMVCGKNMKKENWIKLKTGIQDTLKGKVVDKYAFYRGENDIDEESHFIIKFTDGSYICIGVEMDELDGDYILDNKYCPELSNYHSLPYYVSVTGKFFLDEYIRERVEMGVIEPLSDEDVEEIINKEMEERRNKRYKEYLKLKEEFENNK